MRFTTPEQDELNIWIAEHVKGWRRIEGAEAIADFENRSPSERAQADKYHCKCIWVKGEWVRNETFVEKAMACEECGNMPDFCGDANLALEAAAELVGGGASGHCSLTIANGQVVATLCGSVGGIYGASASMGEPALALCLAMKRFKGVQE